MRHTSSGLHPWRSSAVMVGAFVAASVAVVVLLSGCTAAPTPTPSTPVARPTDVPSPAATLHADGSAAENLPYFTTVIDQVWGSHWNQRILVLLPDNPAEFGAETGLQTGFSVRSGTIPGSLPTTFV